MVAVTGEELMHWVEDTSNQWKDAVDKHPEILSIPCDIRETTSAGQLLQHIVAVELRYAERFHELPQTSYDAIPYDSAKAIYATHDRAMEMVRPLLHGEQGWWETVLEFQTRSAGTLRGSRRTVPVHMLTHSIRHYAQLATLVRHNGIVYPFKPDYLFTSLK